MNKYFQEREELNNLYNAPEYRRLKYCAFAFIAVAICLLLAISIWSDKISVNAMLVMRGCAGVCAIIFVVIVGILSYRVNKQHVNNRNK